MKEADLRRIVQIRTYCEDIADTIKRFGTDYRAFENDRDYVNSVSMSIMQIGELSVGLSDSFKDETGGMIQWNALKGIRNLFAHAYIFMNKAIIWQSAVQDIPELLKVCDKIIEQETNI